MKSLLHYPGGKKRIAPWIIGNMPEHHSYLDPYFGGGAITGRSGKKGQNNNELCVDQLGMP